jgi:hypothetical protein
MRQALVCAVLGALTGGAGGGMVAAFASGGTLDAAYLRNTLCVVLGAGLGSIAGAMVGAVGVIGEAIRDQAKR